MQLDASGEGFPIVLLPGGLTGWLTFEPHAEHWARKRRVIRAQLLNVDFGLRGEPLPADYSVALEAEALLRALDAVEVKDFDLLGWSHGGGVALHVALANPNRVRTLTLAEPDAFWLLRSQGRFGPEAEALQRSLSSYTRSAVTHDQLADFLHAFGVVPEDVDPRSLARWPLWVEHRQALAMGDIPFHHSEDIDEVRAFSKPVLLITGTGSPPHMVDTVAGLGAEFPRARVVELPGGHAMVIVAMERFLETVDEFIGEPH